MVCGPHSVGPTPWSTHAQVATAAAMGEAAERLDSRFALGTLVHYRPPADLLPLPAAFAQLVFAQP